MPRKISDIARDIKKEWKNLTPLMPAFEYLEEMLLIDDINIEIYPPQLGSNREVIARFLGVCGTFRSPKNNPVATKLKNELREIMGFKNNRNM